MLWFYGAVLALSGIIVYIELGLTIPYRFIHGMWLPTPRSGGELNYVCSLIAVHQMLDKPTNIP